VAAYPGPKPASTKPNPDYKYQAFKAQQAAAAAAFPSNAQRSSGRPQQQSARPTASENKDEFFGADTQGFFANRETSQPDFNQRRTAPNSAAPTGADFGSGNNNGFGSFYADADFGPTESAPVVALHSGQAVRGGQASTSLEEILAKKTQANPERPGFTPPKLIERFSIPVVEPSIAYNPPPPAPPVQVFNPKLFSKWDLREKHLWCSSFSSGEKV
jgi:hypothetical protein